MLRSFAVTIAFSFLSFPAWSSKPICQQSMNDFCDMARNAQEQGTFVYKDNQYNVGGYPGFTSYSRDPASYAIIKQLKLIVESYSKIRIILQTANPGDLGVLDNKVQAIRQALENRFSPIEWRKLLVSVKLDLEAMSQLIVPRAPEDVQRDIFLAIYHDRPEYQRVERAYASALSALNSVITDLPFNHVAKQNMLQKVNSVKFKIPADIEACEEQGELGAFYDTDTNSLSACEGFFLSFQSDDTLFMTISHELGHSIDSMNLWFEPFIEKQKSSVMNELMESNGNMDCGKWRVFAKRYINESEKPSTQLWQSFRQCLIQNSELGFSKQEIKVATQMSELALESQLHLTPENSLFNPQHKCYLNPKCLLEMLHMEPHIANFSAVSINVIAQNYRCQKAGRGMPQSGAGIHALLQGETGISVHNVITQSLRISRRYMSERNSLCGSECTDGEHKPSYEYVADWLASRALAKRIKTIPSLNERRDSIMNSMVVFCFAGEGLFDEHATPERRRNAIYNKEISELLDCESSESNNYLNCEP